MASNPPKSRKARRKQRKKKVILNRHGQPLSAGALKMRLLKRLKCTLKYEHLAWAAGAQLVAGVDEVGRGSLFGPVVAAAVILDPTCRIRGLRDSKLLPAEVREKLAARIRQRCIAYSIAAVDAARIDEINIYHASRQAMLLAVQGLGVAPDHLLIDAMKIDHPCSQTKIIHGDALSASIAAASIIAKVERDRMITAMDPDFPAYGLASNKGYSTPRHIASLRAVGPSPLHRQSFAPVWTSKRPQDVLGFMLHEAQTEGEDAAAALEAAPELTEIAIVGMEIALDSDGGDAISEASDAAQLPKAAAASASD